MLRAGANLGLESGQQANAMAMNVANLRQQQEEQAQKMQLAWQEEASRIAAEAARLMKPPTRTIWKPHPTATNQTGILERLQEPTLNANTRRTSISLGKQKLNDLATQNS